MSSQHFGTTRLLTAFDWEVGEVVESFALNIVSGLPVLKGSGNDQRSQGFWTLLELLVFWKMRAPHTQ